MMLSCLCIVSSYCQTMNFDMKDSYCTFGNGPTNIIKAQTINFSKWTDSHGGNIRIKNRALELAIHPSK